MSRRGQGKDQWFARWRTGNCPVHGVGFLDDKEGPAIGGALRTKCPREECTVVVAQWPGKDKHHAKLGWVAGPDEIKAVLVKAGDIDESSPAPGRNAAMVRMSYPVEDEALSLGRRGREE
jgi:hypothetical protein